MVEGLVPFKLVFSSRAYGALAIGTGAAFWILLNIIDQLLFFWPVFAFYVPPEKALGFALSSIIAAVMGIVISGNVLAYRRSRKVHGSVFSGSVLGVASCACAGCSSVALSLVTSLGGIGAAALAFFDIYQVPLRAVSLGILIWTYYSLSRTLSGRAKPPGLGSLKDIPEEE